MSQNLYFWALVAHDPLQTEITRLKEVALQRFHSGRALRSPAHITLIPPIRLAIADLDRIQEEFCWVAQRTSSFCLELDGVRGFSKRVVYIHVRPSKPLMDLSAQMEMIRTKYFPNHKQVHHTFNPHVTLAFRDLSPDLYSEALGYFQELDLSYTWEADHLCRLILAEDGWHVDHICPLRQEPDQIRP